MRQQPAAQSFARTAGDPSAGPAGQWIPAGRAWCPVSARNAPSRFRGDRGGAAWDGGGVHQPQQFRGRGGVIGQPPQRGLHQRCEVIRRIREFLLEGTWTGKLSYIAPDGRPLVAPVWFILADDVLVFNTGAATAKGRDRQGQSAGARSPRRDLRRPGGAAVRVRSGAGVRGAVRGTRRPAPTGRAAGGARPACGGASPSRPASAADNPAPCRPRTCRAGRRCPARSR
jgi:hypothetical protein